MERKEALQVLARLAGNSAEAAEALAALTVQRNRESREPAFLAHFTKAGDTLAEAEAFRLFKVGRRDAYWCIADAIKLAPRGLEARKWIHFTEATETYTLMGIGPKPPAGYTGYVPKAERPTTPRK